MRKAKIIRKTRETDITIELNLDSVKKPGISTTIPFFDHMLTLMAFHSGFYVNIRAKGDTDIDDHHLIEDIGIALGTALKQALGDKKCIVRYANFLMPMDESLSYVAVDISNRPYLDYKIKFKPNYKCDRFDFDLIEDFFRALINSAGITLHIELKHGRNNHHIAESVFKGFGKALSQAVSVGKTKSRGVPSTKGKL